MGGQSHGEIAADLVAEQLTQKIEQGMDPTSALAAANTAVFEYNRAQRSNAGAVAVTAQICPPSQPGENHRAFFYWAGDARGLVARRNPKPESGKAKGRWEWFYRTVDDGLAPQIVQPGRDYDDGGGGKTVAIAVEPLANIVTAGFGGKTTVNIHTVEQGEEPDPRSREGSVTATQYARPNPDKGGVIEPVGIPLQEGDLILLGSDGFWENFGSTQAMLDLVRDCATAEEITRVLSDEAHRRMTLLDQAKQNPKKPLQVDLNGRRAWLFYTYEQSTPSGPRKIHGAVFANKSPKKNERPIDHFKADNLSLVAYLHNPTK